MPLHPEFPGGSRGGDPGIIFTLEATIFVAAAGLVTYTGLARSLNIPRRHHLITSLPADVESLDWVSRFFEEVGHVDYRWLVLRNGEWLEELLGSRATAAVMGAVLVELHNCRFCALQQTPGKLSEKSGTLRSASTRGAGEQSLRPRTSSLIGLIWPASSSSCSHMRLMALSWERACRLKSSSAGCTGRGSLSVLPGSWRLCHRTGSLAQAMPGPSAAFIDRLLPVGSLIERSR